MRFVWICALALAVCLPEATARVHLVELSLLYPAWYLLLSVWLGGWLRRPWVWSAE